VRNKRRSASYSKGGGKAVRPLMQRKELVPGQSTTISFRVVSEILGTLIKGEKKKGVIQRDQKIPETPGTEILLVPKWHGEA